LTRFDIEIHDIFKETVSAIPDDVDNLTKGCVTECFANVARIDGSWRSSSDPAHHARVMEDVVTST
jgi:hypothetical protein